MDSNAVKLFPKSVMRIHDQGLELQEECMVFEWSEIGIVYVDSVAQNHRQILFFIAIATYATFRTMISWNAYGILAIIILFISLVSFVLTITMSSRSMGLMIVHDGVKCFFPHSDTSFLIGAARAIVHKEVGTICDFKTGTVR